MRYSNQKVAVLGAGLSGAAAALLLKGEGADVTVLDSADENKLLKSTIDNLRAQKTRTLLTALGIIFGVGSVIVFRAHIRKGMCGRFWH